MESTELQQRFFNIVKNMLPPHISMVDKIAEVLNLSYDSVYRRIRGEKPITLNEIKVLCDHFGLSLDQVLQLNSEAVVFQAPGINQDDIAFVDYLKGILEQFKYFNSFKTNELLYLCKDLPLWHFYTFSEIGAFKTFCWIKTIHNHPDYRHKSFSLNDHMFTDCFNLGQKIMEEYCKIPSVELWNLESMNSSINQISYYKDADLFEKDEDFERVVDSMDKMIDYFQNMAEAGVKFMPGSSDLMHKASFQLYVNEVVLGNNTILAELDGSKNCFITYNVMSYLITKDARFTKATFQSFHTLLSRSTIISGTGEKYRNNFFRKLRNKVAELRA
jgi:hypothetical protein